MIIDTHVHLYLADFEADREELLRRAENEGVARFLLPAIDSQTHEDLLALVRAYPQKCLPMMGVHPCSIKENMEEELALAENYLDRFPMIAVGEIGLDFYWDTSFIEQQYAAFERQIQWALDKELPVVIHSRESMDECITVIKKYQRGSLRGVFHCFSGTKEQAQQIVDLGFCLGIGGVLTFKKSGLDEVIRPVGMEHIVLETDAPYLTPAPFRGKRNESSYLKYVVEKLADTKQISRQEVEDKTTENAIKLFGLSP